MLALIAWAALLSSSDAQPTVTETYSRSLVLKADEYNLYWNIGTDDITFEVHVKTTGWVGLGIAENANMIGADITFGWISGGKTYLKDAYAPGNGYPEEDPSTSSSDLTLLASLEDSGWTMLKFRRNLAACQETYDREITGDTIRVIWAFGTSDPSGTTISTASKHADSNRGSVSDYLLEVANVKSLPTANEPYSKETLLASSFEIPSTPTYYNCILFQFEKTEKTHLVKASPIVTPGNEKYVHHMILYACGRNIPNDTEVGVNAQCYVGGMQYFAYCSAVIAVWAIGGKDIIYSDVAGVPIGGLSDPTYFQLEIHYDNPSSEAGIVDNSGFELSTTSKLLPNDFGILEVGSVVGGSVNFIPPGASEFVQVGTCAGTCLSNAMTAASVTEVTSPIMFLHSHLAGRKMRLRLVRDGVEIESIRDDYYDFNYQDYRFHNPGITIKSGDSLRMECTYNTEDRSSMTLHSLATTDEMCLGYLLYYPKIDVTRCESFTDPSVSYGYFGVAADSIAIQSSGSVYAVPVASPASMTSLTVGQVMDSTTWTAEKITEFSNLLISGQQSVICENYAKTRVSSLVTMPAINTEYESTTRTCSTGNSRGGRVQVEISCIFLVLMTSCLAIFRYKF